MRGLQLRVDGDSLNGMRRRMDLIRCGTRTGTASPRTGSWLPRYEGGDEGRRGETRGETRGRRGDEGEDGSVERLIYLL